MTSEGAVSHNVINGSQLLVILYQFGAYMLKKVDRQSCQLYLRSNSELSLASFGSSHFAIGFNTTLV